MTQHHFGHFGIALYFVNEHAGITTSEIVGFNIPEKRLDRGRHNSVVICLNFLEGYKKLVVILSKITRY